MCCFSRPVKNVAATNIFARSGTKERQFLVYEMKIAADEDLAMILPIPVPRQSAEDAVRFLNLSDYAGFFKDMAAGFPASRSLDDQKGPRGEAAKPLAVVEVGSFEASFVPSIADFARLDERFRLPAGTWEALPAYKDYGFAVFKLKQGKKQIHPMAFEFPRRDEKRLFFPTVHVHDGKVHGKADFDHALYLQKREGESLNVLGWRESPKLAGSFLKVDRTAGLVDGERHVYLKEIRGPQKNEDVLV
ncbi:MAG TPA: hypothetical protein VFD82_12760 [Planctomycetota bacterium]|nr:hypothetical protein [Planctomycetota bacterium]